MRAYPAGEGSGDDVHIVSAEFQRDLNEKTQVGIFYDWGYTRARDDEDYELDGIGLSFVSIANALLIAICTSGPPPRQSP